MNTDLLLYYKDRAAEYENIYHKPERQADLAALETQLKNLLSGCDLLEIACGTGYWTQKIAETAKKIYATDINPAVLEIANQKVYNRRNVEFGIHDIFQPLKKNYDSLFGGFIWSHIKLQDLSEFINVVHDSVKPGSRVVFVDNKFVEGSNHPITRSDVFKNTFQTRKLSDGSTHEVLKNFPTEKLLRDCINGLSSEVQYIDMQYYWLLTYRTT